ncbi:MAG: energy transducer TonB [Terriglobales bacterium]
MFTESLLESSARSRRGWTTVLSFAVQAAGIAALVLLPLFRTQALPAIVALGAMIGPPPGKPPRAEAERRTTRASTSEIVGLTVREPRGIPRGVADIQDQSAPEPAATSGFAVPGGTGTSAASTQVIAIFGLPPRPPEPPPSTQQRLKISSGVSQGYLLRQLRPAYPPMAISAHVQGAVVLSALISRTGEIENLQVLSGHPLLVAAAVEAVKHWRYRPCLLNGDPVEVETQITVNFSLGGS